MNYSHKKFEVISNSDNGEADASLVFHYEQTNNILTCTYRSETILEGHLIGLVDEQGTIDMRYHQINKQGQLMTGICKSRPEILADGKIKLHEEWQWTSGDLSAGKSTLIEI